MRKLYKADISEIPPPSTKIYLSFLSPPPSMRDDTVTKICSIKWAAPVDISSLPTFTNSIGKVYHVMLLEYRLNCSGASVDFAVYYNGKKQGAKNIVIDYDSE